MATLYKTNGEVTEVTPANGETFSYEELKEFVEGLIEVVPLPSGKYIIVNEEGKLIGLKKNEKATEVWGQEYPKEKYPYNNDELIVGNALVLTSRELGE